NEGAFQNNIVKLVANDLRAALRSSLNDAKRHKRQIESHRAILRSASGSIKIGIIVQPMPQLGKDTGLYLIVFRDLGMISEKEIADDGHKKIDFTIIEELEAELARLREELDKSIQDLE